MPVPLEIVVGPADVYAAPVGTTFPVINAAPSGSWVLVGTAGADNYTEDGVVLRRTVTNNLIRALGSTTPRKAVISETGYEVEFNVMDMKLEAMALAYGVLPSAVVAAAGPPSIKSLDIPTSPIPLQQAILVRSTQSPYIEPGNLQFQIYQAIQMGTGEGTYSKADAFATGHNWSALKDSSGQFVKVVALNV